MPQGKALVIGIDGVQYEALQQALVAARMPSLQGLGTVLPAYTGGIKGKTTQQQATDGPAWATLLTGAWADRHEIRSNYEGQSFKADTVFKLLKQSHASARTAAIASWSGLPQLLRADRAAGYLDLVKDCEGNDSCVSSEAAAAIEGGGARAGDKDLNFSANTWVYAAMVVDVPGLTARFYVYDPVYGMQNASVRLTSAYVAALNGLNNGFTLNEDGDGGYGPGYRNGNASNTIGGRFDFGEFGTWNRVLTALEVESIGRSGTSLTTLVP